MQETRNEGRFHHTTAGARGPSRLAGWTVVALMAVGVPHSVAAQGSGSEDVVREVKVRGVIMERFPDGFTLKEHRGTEVDVDLSVLTEIKEEKRNFLRPALEYSPGHLIPALEVKVEGTRSGGRILAEKVKFTQDALEVARTITSQLEPVESELAETHLRLETLDGRLGRSEARGQQLSGDVDELEEAVRLNRSRMRQVEGKAEQALGGVAATNRRLNLMDRYETEEVLTVHFPFNSFEISEQARGQLDALAEKLIRQQGFLVEIRGFSSADGDALHNLELSQRRADRVRRYLVERHQVSMRRFVAPFGYGAQQPVGDDATLQGRQANRRVELRVLVSPGHRELARSGEVSPAPNPFRP